MYERRCRLRMYDYPVLYCSIPRNRFAAILLLLIYHKNNIIIVNNSAPKSTSAKHTVRGRAACIWRIHIFSKSTVVNVGNCHPLFVLPTHLRPLPLQHLLHNNHTSRWSWQIDIAAPRTPSTITRTQSTRTLTVRIYSVIYRHSSSKRVN